LATTSARSSKPLEKITKAAGKPAAFFRLVAGNSANLAEVEKGGKVPSFRPRGDFLVLPWFDSSQVVENELIAGV